MKVDHAIVVLFNVYRGPVPGTDYLRGTHDASGRPNQNYVDRRIPVFIEHTLRSLGNQSSRNFFIVFMYEKRSKIHEEAKLEFSLFSRETGIPFEYAPIEPINFSTTSGYQRAFWARRLPEEAAVRRHAKHPRLLITYLDGDDYLCQDYVTKIQAARVHRATQAIVCGHGYAYDSVRDRMRLFDRKSPPFFTLSYSTQEYLAGRRYYGGPGRHLWVPESLRHTRLMERLWVQQVHSINDSSTFEMQGGGRLLSEAEKREVLKTIDRSEKLGDFFVPQRA